MAGKGGARDGAGRKLGGKNKNVMLELLHSKYPDWHPLLAMAEIANDEESDQTLKLQACKEICKYVSPQLRAVELTGKDGKDLIPSLSDDELLARINKVSKSPAKS